jgi:hypothetical protein
MRNYYTVLDFAAERVGIALNTYSTAIVTYTSNPLNPDTPNDNVVTPTGNQTGTFPGWAIALIVCGILTFLIVVGIAFWIKYKNKKLHSALVYQ